MSNGEPGDRQVVSVRARLVRLTRVHPAVSLVALVGAVAVIYVAVGQLWPSDERRITATVTAVTRSLVEGDAEAALEYVSPYFLEEGLDKRGLAMILPRAVGRRPITRASSFMRQLSVGSGRAAAKVYVQSFHGEGLSGEFARSEWIVTLEEINGRWLIRTATPERVNQRSVGGLRAVLALGY